MIHSNLGACAISKDWEQPFASAGRSLVLLRTEKFAQWIGMDPAQYGRIERGDADISVQTLFDLAGHLGIAPYCLIRDMTLDDCLLAEVSDDAT